MCETLLLFGEFPKEDISNEVRHQKRTRLEPLIFDILKKKYSNALDAFWDSYTPSVDSDRCVILVERRIHENIEFVLKNAAYFCRGWSLCIVCSDVNLEYCRKIAGKHQDKITFLVAFQGIADRDTGRKEFSDLMKNPNFYSGLPWQHLIFTQEDAYFRRDVPESILNYDFVASPAFWDTTAMVGGISFRNRDAMVRVCREFKEPISWEDCFFDAGTKALGLRRPLFDDALDFFCESCFSENPVACHQWWTYFSVDFEEAEFFFHRMLDLAISPV